MAESVVFNRPIRAAAWFGRVDRDRDVRESLRKQVAARDDARRRPTRNRRPGLQRKRHKHRLQIASVRIHAYRFPFGTGMVSLKPGWGAGENRGPSMTRRKKLAAMCDVAAAASEACTRLYGMAAHCGHCLCTGRRWRTERAQLIQVLEEQRSER